ncbi:MAG: 6,7-dimethyl-8-ribityllumazine synthase [Chthoniobacterales bacterium]
MSVNLPLRPRMAASHGHHRIAIVASEYNPEFVQPLVDNTSRELYAIHAGISLELFSVPGAFEVPLAVKLLAAKKRVEAIIALGVIIRGETEHADLIAHTVTDSLQRISLEFGIPIIHEVLLLNDEAQAKARCIDTDHNRGIEAARAALQMVKSVTDIQQLK